MDYKSKIHKQSLDSAGETFTFYLSPLNRGFEPEIVGPIL